jgi:hypothetical protein
MAQRKTHFCAACDSRVVALRPHWSSWVAVAGAYAFFVVLTALVGAGGLLIFGGGVVVFALGSCVLGPLHALAARPPTCPNCRRMVARIAA